VFYPGPNVSTGDPTVNSLSEPPTSGVTNLGSWLTNPATALTNGSWSGLQNIPSNWAVNDETAIIYEVEGGATGYSNLVGNFGVDNGIYVWVNGTYKFGAMAPGGSVAYEYSNINLGTLNVGTNYIQILREDHGGATGYDVLITADPTSIPEPLTILGTLAALGFGTVFKKKSAY
jgi:hypothetical protein